MDQEILVERQILDGQKLVDQLIQGGFPVTVAFWLKTYEDSKWYLYIASPVVEDEGTLGGYRRTNAVLREMPEPFGVEPLTIKLIAPTNPLAEDVVANLKRYPRKMPGPYGGARLGGVTIDGAYLYPLPVGAADK